MRCPKGATRRQRRMHACTHGGSRGHAGHMRACMHAGGTCAHLRRRVQREGGRGEGVALGVAQLPLLCALRQDRIDVLRADRAPVFMSTQTTGMCSPQHARSAPASLRWGGPLMLPSVPMQGESAGMAHGQRQGVQQRGLEGLALAAGLVLGRAQRVRAAV